MNLILSVLSILVLTASTATAFIGGELAVKGQFPSVVWIEYGCTGSIIAPNAILLAGHCVQTYKNDYTHFSGQSIRVYNRPVAIESTPLSGVIKKVHIHPEWSEAIQNTDLYSALSDSSIADVAVLELEQNIFSDNSVSIADLNFTKLNKNSEVIVGGYGCEKMGEPTRSPRYKYARKKISSNRQDYFFTPQINSDLKSYSMGCEGDSGGPVFVLNSKGKLEQIGINSRVRGDETDGRMRSLYLYAIQDWLQQTNLIKK